MRRQKMRQIHWRQVGILISAKKFQNLFTSSKKKTSELSVSWETTMTTFLFLFLLRNKKSFQSVRVNKLMPNSLLINVGDKNPRDINIIFYSETRLM
jgi:hypothetical protein